MNEIIRNSGILAIFTIIISIALVIIEIMGNHDLANQLGFILLAPLPMWIILAIIEGMFENNIKNN